jgi:protein associated with RNAse G/E
MLRTGEIIQVIANKSDGQAYRRWSARVEAAMPEEVVTVTFPGNQVTGPGLLWLDKWVIRSFYWPGRPYNLLEVYWPDGAVREVYIHIASPPVIESTRLSYTDLELDVVRFPGETAQLIDEDEFAQAAQVYGYTTDFQAACYRAAQEALALAERWTPGGLPQMKTGS